MLERMRSIPITTPAATAGFVATLLVALTLSITIVESASAARLGAGLHYLRAVSDIDPDGEFDKNDFAIFGTYTVSGALINIEGNLEVVPDYLGSDNVLFQPAAYGLLDLGLLYGGVGIGIGYLDGDWASQPFFALRGGAELELGGLALDAFLSYRFQNADFGDAVRDLDLDTLTLAAQIKFGE